MIAGITYFLNSRRVLKKKKNPLELNYEEVHEENDTVQNHGLQSGSDQENGEIRWFNREK